MPRVRSAIPRGCLCLPRVSYNAWVPYRTIYTPHEAIAHTRDAKKIKKNKKYRYNVIAACFTMMRVTESIVIIYGMIARPTLMPARAHDGIKGHAGAT